MIFRRRKSVAKGARSTPRCIAALALVLAWAPTIAGEAGAGDRHGLEPGDPVEVCRFTVGERLFAALVCPTGERPSINRTGSVGPRTGIPKGMTTEAFVRRTYPVKAGETVLVHAAEAAVAMVEGMLRMRPLEPGEPDYHVLDAYELRCGTTVTTLYLDGYHCQSEPPLRAPAGFTLAPQPEDAGNFGMARAAARKLGMGGRLEGVARQVARTNPAFAALVSVYGEEVAARRLDEEIARAMPRYRGVWEDQAAAIYMRHLDRGELLSVAVDGIVSPGGEKLKAAHDRIGPEMQAAARPLVEPLVAEALRNAKASLAQAP